METTEIIRVLSKLAEVEGLYVELPDNEESERPRRRSAWNRSSNLFESSGTQNLPKVHSFGITTAAGGVVGEGVAQSSGSLWGGVGGFAWNAASSVWKYVTRNYGVSVRVQVLPVNDLLMRLRDPHRERLADKLRKIMNEHSVIDLNAVADKIQQDSSLNRQIILKYLVEYLTEDMSLPVKNPALEDSLHDSDSS